MPYGSNFGIKDKVQKKPMTIAEYMEYMDGVAAWYEEKGGNSNSSKSKDGSSEGAEEDLSTLLDDDDAPAAAPQYIFSKLSNEVSISSPLYKDIANMLLPIIKPSQHHTQGMWRYQTMQFFLGAIGTGAPIHFHTHAYNLLMYGKKRWVVSPPRHAAYSKQHITTWMQSNPLPADKAATARYECIQLPGDIVYVPDSWAHGVLNLAESVGFAMEFEALENLLSDDEDRDGDDDADGNADGDGVRGARAEGADANGGGNTQKAKDEL